MNLSELQTQLRAHDTAEVSYKTGLSIATIDAIKSGRNKNPTTKTFTALAGFLEMKANELPSSSQKSNA